MSHAYQIIGRDEAHARGMTTYYTGTPCKRGHLSRRYVANAGCLACLERHKFTARRNSYSRDLVPFDGPTLWRSRRLDPKQLDEITKALQGYLDTLCEHFVGKVCAECDGQKVVPTGDGRNAWKPCPLCAEPKANGENVVPD
jgi:hypothetical protein